MANEPNQLLQGKFHFSLNNPLWAKWQLVVSYSKVILSKASTSPPEMPCQSPACNMWIQETK